MKTKSLSGVKPRVGMLLYFGKVNIRYPRYWDFGFYLIVKPQPEEKEINQGLILEPSGELHPWHWSALQCEGFVVVETTDEE